MKKFFLAIAIVALAATNVMAQDAIPVKKYSVATNSFWANWFVQVGANAHMMYSDQEQHDLGFFRFKERANIGAALAIGKWFTPSIGLRTKFRAYRTRRVNGEGISNPGFTYVGGEEDVMFNLSNLFCGYNETRVWNFIPYAGVGLYYATKSKNLENTFNVGIMNTWRLGKRVGIFFDVYAMWMDGNFDGSSKAQHDWTRERKLWLRHWDKQLGVDLGLTFNISKTTGWAKVPDVDALMAMNKEQVDALNASLREQQDENARLRNMLANQQPAQTNVQTETKVIKEKELVGAAASVFFNINSSKIASRKDLVNVKELAEYAKNNNAKIVVTGYADSKTGSSATNSKLSQARAEAVAAELVKMGVNKDNIECVAAGGVDNLTPFSYNRRATVVLK